MTRADLLQALRDCFDAALQCNIVDLGEVADANLTEDRDAPGAGIAGVPARYSASVLLILPTHDDLAESQMIAQIQNRLAGLPYISRTTIDVARDAVWTPERITPEGRRTLGLDKPIRGGLIQIKL